MTQITPDARREVVRAVAQRYTNASRWEKARILDEFVAITGYHRKHAIRLLNAGDVPITKRKRVDRDRTYDEAVRQALVVMWEASDRICGKRLKPLLPILIPALERHGHLQLDPVLREKLFRISPATIDRILAPTRAAATGKQRRRQKPAVRSSVPIRTFNDWKEPPPGFVEADLVAHCGSNMAGSFAHSLVLTDISSAWTECVALAVRESTLVVDSA